VLTAELGYGLYQQSQSRLGFLLAPPSTAAGPAGNTQAIGLALYQDYMLPVEIASVLLLVAMVGAVIMAKRKFD